MLFRQTGVSFRLIRVEVYCLKMSDTSLKLCNIERFLPEYYNEFVFPLVLHFKMVSKWFKNIALLSQPTKSKIKTIHSLARSLTHSLTRSVTQSVSHPPSHPPELSTHPMFDCCVSVCEQKLYLTCSDAVQRKSCQETCVKQNQLGKMSINLPNVSQT